MSRNNTAHRAFQTNQPNNFLSISSAVFLQQNENTVMGQHQSNKQFRRENNQKLKLENTINCLRIEKG